MEGDPQSASPNGAHIGYIWGLWAYVGLGFKWVNMWAPYVPHGLHLGPLGICGVGLQVG